MTTENTLDTEGESREMNNTENETEERRVDDLTKALPVEAFTKIQLQGKRPRTVWVAIQEVEFSKYTGKKVSRRSM